MKRFIRLGLLTAVLAVITVAGLYGYIYWDAYYNSNSSQSSNTLKILHQLPWQDEQSWIATSIANDIAEMLSYPGDVKQSPTVTSAKVSAETGQLAISYHSSGFLSSFFPKKFTRSLSTYLWDSTLYSDFAAQLGKEIPPAKSAPSTAPKEDILENLLDLKVAVIEGQNQRVSTWLTQEPRNPAAHEEAALLCGVMALRECSHCFYDARPALNRLTAHLAIARMLQGGALRSDAGMAAQIISEVLSGREKDATEHISAWQKARPDVSTIAAWAKALSVRNTSNWSLISSPGAEPLLVRLEYMRALAAEATTERAMAFWQEDGTLKSLSDSAHYMFSNYPSVGQGHVFSAIGLKLELKEINDLFQKQNKTFAMPLLVAFVNATPSGAVARHTDSAPTIQVIDEGAWGRYFQRHLLHQISAIYYHINQRWGVPEKARQFRNSLTPTFSQFLYFPLLDLDWSSKTEIQQALPPARKLGLEHPELIGENNVFLLEKYDSEFVSLFNSWFNPVEPIGTTYAGHFRYRRSGFLNKIDDYLSLSPTNSDIVWRGLHLHDAHEKSPLEKVQKLTAPLLDHNLWALKTVAEAVKNTPDQYEVAYEKVSALDPGAYFKLGDWYVAQNQPEKAAVAYQNGYDKCQDHVQISNSVRWLVNYYYDHDRKDEALKIAQMAAEVYSFRGLETMLELQEKMGNLSQAIEYGQKIKERYEDGAPLAGVYLRHKDLPGADAFLKELNSAESKLFPNGISRVTLDSFKDAPTEGITLGASDRLTSLGITPRVVIVALDGVQVRNEKQYIYVRGLSPSPKMDLIVWKNGKYESMMVEQEGRRFGVQIIDYHK